MRFVVTGEWTKNSLLRLILFFFLVFILFFWVTNWILYFQKMTLDPASVVAYYRGDGTEFGLPPRPLGALAETSHFHLFAMGMLVMTLTHLVLFVPVSPRIKGTLTLVTFLGALLNEASGWLVRFVGPGFAVLKVGCFLLLQAALFGLIVITMAGVLRPARNGNGSGYSHGHGEGPPPARSGA